MLCLCLAGLHALCRYGIEGHTERHACLQGAGTKDAGDAQRQIQAAGPEAAGPDADRGGTKATPHKGPQATAATYQTWRLPAHKQVHSSLSHACIRFFPTCDVCAMLSCAQQPSL